MAAGYRPYPEEFRDSAVREVVENSRSMAAVASQMSIDAGTLRRWVQSYKERQSELQHEQMAAATDSKILARIVELETENKQLREREIILKRAAAVFAQDVLEPAAHAQPAPTLHSNCAAAAVPSSQQRR